MSKTGKPEPVELKTAEDEDESEEEDEDDIGDLPPPPPARSGKARTSVSGEAYGEWNKRVSGDSYTPPVHPKSELLLAEIEKVLSECFLFGALNEDEIRTVAMAMQERTLKPSESPIQQGDDGDELFVVKEGVLECYKDDKLVKTCTKGDVFGELALMYSAPRAASVKAKEKCIVWSLDRTTFNIIVKCASDKKQKMHTDFLESVELLKSMSQKDRNKIADALKTSTYNDKDIIVKQGEFGDKFYFLEEGEAVATKLVEGSTPVLMTYKRGDYFGELSMIKCEPRAATVVSVGTCRCAWLDRKAFRRLLGPVESFLEKHKEKYG
eukprot:GHVR01139065.1.p1 GENE.GHVR01139065.1~~GHVR01139065.1.p1  ORF type:complete len:324 (+),score=81.82 GHVR01139065.1:55-1026(+)